MASSIVQQRSSLKQKPPSKTEGVTLLFIQYVAIVDFLGSMYGFNALLVSVPKVQPMPGTQIKTVRFKGLSLQMN